MRNLPIAEFDGAILAADGDSGRMALYLSEAKRGVSNKKASTVLSKRLKELGYQTSDYTLRRSPFGAYVRIDF